MDFNMDHPDDYAGPPPSTLAAQIVENIQHARPRRERTDGLQNLLNEFLTAGTNAFVGTDLPTRYQLVDLLLKACTQSLDNAGPFDGDGWINDQAVQVLEVIQSAIIQSTDLLLFSPDAGSSGNEGSVPFFLSLLPRLFQFVGNRYSKSVSDAGLKAIQACRRADTKGAFLKTTFRPVARYIKLFIKDILSCLEQNTIDSNAILPSDATISDVWRRADFARAPRVNVPRPALPWMLLIAANLLSLFAPTDIRGQHISDAFDIGLLKAHAQLVQSIRRWNTATKAYKSTAELLTAVMSSLRAFLRPPAHKLLHRQALCICIPTLCDTLQQALKFNMDSSNPSLSSRIRLSLVTIMHIYSDHSLHRDVIYGGFAAYLQDLLDEPGNWAKVDLDTRLTFLMVASIVLDRELQPVESYTEQMIDRTLAEDLSKITLSVLPDFALSDTSNGRPSKRPRIDNASDEERRDGPRDRLAALLKRLGLPQWTDAPFTPDLQERLPKDEATQIELLTLVSRAICYEISEQEQQPCPSCDADKIDTHNRSKASEMLHKYSITLLATLALGSGSRRSIEPVVKTSHARVLLLLAFDGILCHTSDPNMLILDDERPLGKWCIEKCLTSRTREIRTAAARVSRHFMLYDLDPEISRKNRIKILDVLGRMSARNIVQEHEACIWTLGQLAKLNLGHDEMNLILFRLVNYLGHPSPLISALAYDELLRLSDHDTAKAKRLLDPYWSSIAVQVVGDLTTKPSALQRLCDILDVSVSFFISFTRTHTVPYLVLNKKRDVLERIAAATIRPDNTPSSIAQLCLSNDQLPSLFAMMLMTPSHDPESLIHTLLSYATPEFDDMQVIDLLKIDQAPIAFEIFQRAGELGIDSESQARKAIEFLAQQGSRRQTSSARRTSKGPNTTEQANGVFFETHSLAIVKSLSDIITEAERVSDRRRCLIGLRQMIAIAGDSFFWVLPQASACLRSTMSDSTLSGEAFAAWDLMVRSLQDIKTLIEPTFALIQQHWNYFNVGTQQQAQELIDWLFSEKKDVMHDMVLVLPSLGGIKLLEKYENEINKFKNQLDQKRSLQALTERLISGDLLVTLRALEELEIYLENNASFLQQSVQSERPEPMVARSLQLLLDTCVRLSANDERVAIACSRCLGTIGCLDPSRIDLEVFRDTRDMVILSDFVDRNETVDFVIFLLEEIIVPLFLSNMNTRSQNFLGFAMQELLRVCDFRFSTPTRAIEDTDAYRKWRSMTEDSHAVLKPFMTSKYTLKEGIKGEDCQYPVFKVEKSHGGWLREFVFDVLRKASGDNAIMVFGICKRIVRGQDIAIASFLLPYIVLNVLIGDDLQVRANIATEFMSVLGCPLNDVSQPLKDNAILCSQDVFRTMDYLSKWTHEKRRWLANHRIGAAERQDAEHAIQVVQTLLDRSPAEIMANRAMECKNYSRALFYWEQYIRQWTRENAELLNSEPQAADSLYEKLQSIYVAIDEPDGIEGASAYLQLLDTNQQVMEHRKAGRWAAVQNWDELLLAEDPVSEEIQTQLLSSIRESGQFENILHRVATMGVSDATKSTCQSFAIEASWETSNWQTLSQYAPKNFKLTGGDFTSGIGAALCALYNNSRDSFESIVTSMQVELARGLSKSSVASLQTCRQTLLQMHALREVELIADVHSMAAEPAAGLASSLELRLNSVGAFSSDKQYILGLRRAAMQLSNLDFSSRDISAAWITSARLFRKQGATSQAFRAILNASFLEDERATIEHARILWKEGNHRKAIQSLEGAISANAFENHTTTTSFEDSIARTADPSKQQNVLEAKARLLLARWIDQAGQTQSDAIIKQYQDACGLHTRWEKGQYCLGRHYDKLLESEKTKAPGKMAQTVLTGELAKHVIENYIRGMAWGAKYVYQTLPRCLTLWCEMGSVVDQQPDSKYGTDEVFRAHVVKNRKKIFDMTLAQLKKYVDRLPAWIFYTALNQVCARICHTNVRVQQTMSDIVVKVCVTHPQQALWPLLAMVRSTQPDRMARGQQCIAKVQEQAKKQKTEGGAAEIKLFIVSGSRTTEQLLDLCNADLKRYPRKQTTASLKELGFQHKSAEKCRLVLPVQENLTLTLPPVTDGVSTRQHKAFSKDVVTIASFLDEVLLMSSLQRPRKIDVRGSNGKTYSLLCKPKDDLRLDQRLLEFNAMIQRLLKKDSESSKRRMYVKTYAVTPLNEECGLIEWVDGLKTHRDILLKLYTNHGIQPDYRDIQGLLEEAVQGDMAKFTDQVMSMFPCIFHEWFTETFPEPEAWYSARMRYTRSSAVMSMVGHALGLGDRHSENIMIEEGNGGIMHVDFNCLFDKGQTFEKPEKVPFRLTANMVDAFGSYGHEGPFRKACELTLGILRQNEDTFMTILEQFLHDPTIDLMGNRKKKANVDVPNTPEGVLESVRNKLRGLLPKESVPLSVEGHVEHLITQARDPLNLASMYIGWCAFL